MPDPSNSQEQEITLAKALANAKQLKSERYPSNAKVRTAMKEIRKEEKERKRKEGRLEKRHKESVDILFSRKYGSYKPAEDNPENYPRIGRLEFISNLSDYKHKFYIRVHVRRLFAANGVFEEMKNKISSLEKRTESYTTKVKEIEKCLTSLKTCEATLKKSIPVLNKNIKNKSALERTIARIRWAVPFLKRNATYSKRAKQLKQQKKIIRDIKKLEVIRIAYIAVNEYDQAVLKIVKKDEALREKAVEKNMRNLKYQKIIWTEGKKKGIKSRKLKKWARDIYTSNKIPKGQEWDKLVKGCDFTNLAIAPGLLSHQGGQPRRNSLSNKNHQGMSQG